MVRFAKRIVISDFQNHNPKKILQLRSSNPGCSGGHLHHFRSLSAEESWWPGNSSIVWNPRRGRVASIQCTVDGLWLRGPNTGVTSVEMIWTCPRGVLWCCFFQMCHRCLGPWSQKIWMWNGHWLQGSSTSISLCPVTRSFYHHLTCSDILWPPTPISLFCYVQHAHIYPILTPHLSAAVLNAFSAVDAPKRFARAANFSSSVREIDASRCEWTTSTTITVVLPQGHGMLVGSEVLRAAWLIGPLMWNLQRVLQAHGLLSIEGSWLTKCNRYYRYQEICLMLFAGFLALQLSLHDFRPTM